MRRRACASDTTHQRRCWLGTRRGQIACNEVLPLRLHRAQARSYRSWLREILGGDSDVVHMTLGKPIDPIFVGAGSPAMGHYG